MQLCQVTLQISMMKVLPLNVSWVIRLPSWP